jgi:hypothetical protein
MKGSIETKAGLACLYAGAVWGLFWIPLRDTVRENCLRRVALLCSVSR